MDRVLSRVTGVDGHRRKMTKIDIGRDFQRFDRRFFGFGWLTIMVSNTLIYIPSTIGSPIIQAYNGTTLSTWKPWRCSYWIPLRQAIGAARVSDIRQRHISDTPLDPTIPEGGGELGVGGGWRGATLYEIPLSRWESSGCPIRSMLPPVTLRRPLNFYSFYMEYRVYFTLPGGLKSEDASYLRGTVFYIAKGYVI